MGGWTISEMREISALKEKSANLREAISTKQDSRGERVSVKSSAAKPQGDLDLQQVGSSLAKVQTGGGLSEMEALIQFEQRLSKMSKEELLAALESLTGLNLSPEARLELEKMILAQLVTIDPAAALKRYAGKIKDAPNEIGLQLAEALKEWATNDLTGAAAWLDQQIASGNFDSKTLDGRSDMRTQFEAALMESLVSSNSDEAGRRLEGLPEDQRREVLEQIPFADLSPDAQKAYAELVRQWIPNDERGGSFADMAGKLVDGNAFSQVGDFLDSIQATPAERFAAAKQSAESQLDVLSRAGTVTIAAVDELRTWIKQQAPDQVDRISGKSLAEASQNGGKLSTEEAGALVLQYQQRTGSDDMLVAFLDGYAAHSNLSLVQSYVGTLRDPTVRATYIR